MPRSERPGRPAAPDGTARPRLRRALLVLVCLLGALGPAAPAAAHDVLVSTDPADGAALAEAPAQVTLTFSADQIDVGTAVRVVDAAGRDHADGAPRVEGPTVVQPLTELAPGAYEVVWRSVSSDGHTLDGTFGFEVAPTQAQPSEDPAAQPSEEPAAEPTAEPATEPMTGSTPEATEEPAVQDATEDGAGSALPLVLGALGLAVVVAVVALLARRRRS